MKRLMWYTAVVLTTLLVLTILWQFRLILLLFVLSLFVAATIRPLVIRLAKWGVRQTAAQILIYLAGTVGLVLVVFLLGDALLLELNILANRLVIEFDQLRLLWEKGAAWQQTAVSYLNQLPLATTSEAELSEMIPTVVIVTQGVATALGSVLLLLALSIYWSADRFRFERLWLSQLPPVWRAFARDSWREIEVRVGGYLRSQAIKSLLAAFFLGSGAFAAGLQFPLLFGLLGALASLVPLFGSLIMAALAFGLGALQSINLGLGAAIYVFIILLGLEFFVEPMLWPRKRRSFLLTMILLLPLLEAFGAWGLLIAPPLAAAAEVIVTQTYQIYMERQATAVKIEDLENRFQIILHRANEAEYGRLTPELQNLTKRFADLLAASHNLGQNASQQ